MGYYNYNPYKFIFFIPVAVISGLVYFIISSWDRLNNSTLSLLIVFVMLAITFLGYLISKENHPLRGMQHERGAVEDILQKIIEQRKGPIPDLELQEIRTKTENIMHSTIRRAERAMRIKLLIEEYIQKGQSTK